MNSKNKIIIFLALATFIFLSNSVFAEITFSSGLIKKNIPGKNITSGFVSINSNTQISLIDITSPLFDKIEVHSMKIEKNNDGDEIMRMRKLETIIIKPNLTLELKKGGDHIMFYGLKRDLIPNEQISLKFTFHDQDNKLINKDELFQVQ